MKVKILPFILILLFSESRLHADEKFIRKGMFEVSFSEHSTVVPISRSQKNYYFFDINGSFGYFLLDCLNLSAGMSYLREWTTESYEQINLFSGAEFDVPVRGRVIPLIRVNAYWFNIHDWNIRKKFGVFDINAGIRIFITPIINLQPIIFVNLYTDRSEPTYGQLITLSFVFNGL